MAPVCGSKAISLRQSAMRHVLSARSWRSVPSSSRNYVSQPGRIAQAFDVHTFFGPAETDAGVYSCCAGHAGACDRISYRARRLRWRYERVVGRRYCPMGWAGGIVGRCAGASGSRASRGKLGTAMIPSSFRLLVFFPLTNLGTPCIFIAYSTVGGPLQGPAGSSWYPRRQNGSTVGVAGWVFLCGFWALPPGGAFFVSWPCTYLQDMRLGLTGRAVPAVCNSTCDRRLDSR